MGAELADHPACRNVYEQAAEALGYDVRQLCKEGPQSRLDQTIYAQPAIFVQSMAALERLKSETDEFDERVTETAGFSVGEFSALVLAGILGFEDGAQ